jgi:hypothetical protein
MKSLDIKLRFRTIDHPEANGRQPKAGEVAYVIVLPLEDGRSLELGMGPIGITKFREFLGSIDLDDAQ